MPKHVSLKDQISTALEDIASNINGRNAKIALPILKWTLDKIQLSYSESLRIDRNIPPRHVDRGGIYYATLGKNIGSEQSGYRPVLIVQSNDGNVSNNTVLVIPLTDFLNKNGQPKKILGTHIVLELVNYPELSKKSIIKTEHTNNISKNRLRNKICDLSPTTLLEVDSKILISLGIKNA